MSSFFIDSYTNCRLEPAGLDFAQAAGREPGTQVDKCFALVLVNPTISPAPDYGSAICQVQTMNDLSPEQRATLRLLLEHGWGGRCERIEAIFAWKVDGEIVYALIPEKPK